MINFCLKVGPHFCGLIVKFKHELEHGETMLDGCKFCTCTIKTIHDCILKDRGHDVHEHRSGDIKSVMW